MTTMKKQPVPQVWRERFAQFAVTESDLPKAR